MDRIRFIPGKEAKDQMFEANGLIYFGREVAADMADEFILRCPNAAQRWSEINIVYQTALACLSEGDRIDIRFGLRDTNEAAGLPPYPSGELIGHTWATLTAAGGGERVIWEVGRDTPPAGHPYGDRAFNAYREAVAAFLGEEPPAPLPVDTNAPAPPAEFRGNPIISRSLAPSNLYHASARMWYYVDLVPFDGLDSRPLLSRPMRAFDAVILASIITLANGKPPIVFGIRPTLDGLGKMPEGYVRALYEDDQRVEPTDKKPLLVM
ncbi:hypothetical protein jhhlp_007459 [Lomentospora prolificans]|uniref:Uncharacterized protein n=1 Tax=Lomentospora prolificans TaxID=41688 RepID=A0A2N3N154_9PEZI|nr:hypothetical protein jhhlp_007459 [Lomentospora prolificans]